MPENISIIIHTYNEENNIEECIRCAHILSGTVIVIDMHSTDRTANIARRLGACVFFFPFSHYVEPAREFGISKAQTDWVYVLDADERMTKESAEEIKAAISDNSFSYYKIPRKNIFGRARWLKYGGWWPDYQIRLINKKYLKSWPAKIHSTPFIEGNSRLLQNPLLHYFHGDIETMVEKTIIFEDIESDLLFKAGKTVSVPIFFRKFFGELFRRFAKNAGFLDGGIGIIESIYQAFSKTITYIFLYEKKSSSL